MDVRRFAQVFGIIYIVVGVLGFVPGITAAPPADATPLAVGALYGNLLGIFPVNLIHDIVHLAIGAWGLMSAKTVGSAVSFARGLAIVYAVLTVAGFIPGLSTLFGLAPLFGNDIWLHALSAIVAAYFGWGAASKTQTA